MMVIMMVPIAGGAYLQTDWTTEKQNNDEMEEPCGLCVYDTDNDGFMEILVGTDHGSVEVYDGKTKEWEWSVTFPNTDRNVDAIRVGNVDDDPNLEVIVSLDGGMFTGGFGIADVTTKDLQYVNNSLGETHSLTIADIDANAREEILVASDDILYVFGYDGSDFVEIWQSPEMETDINAVVVGDIDTEPTKEIIVGYTSGEGWDEGGITVFSQDFTEKWSKNDLSNPVLGLWVDSGLLFISTGTAGFLTEDEGGIFVFSGSSELLSLDVGEMVLSITAGNFTNDESVELVVGTNERVMVYTNGLTKLGQGPTIGESGRYGNIFISDINNDNKKEIIVHSNEDVGELFEFDYESRVYVLSRESAGEGEGGDESSGSYYSTSNTYFLVPLIVSVIGLLVSISLIAVKKKVNGLLAGGLVLLILGLLLAAMLNPLMCESVEDYDTWAEDSPAVLDEIRVGGFIKTEDTTSDAPNYRYYLEGSDTSFISGEDLGDEGDYLIVTLIWGGNEPVADSKGNAWLFPIIGMVLVVIGMVLSGIGAKKASKTKGIPGRGGGIGGGAGGGFGSGGAGAEGGPNSMKNGCTALKVGGIVHLIQNLIIVLFVVMILIGVDSTSSSDDSLDDDSENPLGTTTEYMFYSILFIDIIAYFAYGIGAFLFQSGVGAGPMYASEIKKSGKIAGVLALLMGVFSLLWRFVFPVLIVGKFADLFGGDFDINEFLTLIRLMFLIAIIASFLLPAMSFFIRKMLKTAGDMTRIQVKSGMLTVLLVASVLNMIMNLMWQIPIMQTFTSGDSPGYGYGDALIVVVFMKIFVLPFMFMAGAYGVIKSSSELSTSGKFRVSESRSSPNVDISHLLASPRMGGSPSPPGLTQSPPMGPSIGPPMGPPIGTPIGSSIGQLKGPPIGPVSGPDTMTPSPPTPYSPLPQKPQNLPPSGPGTPLPIPGMRPPIPQPVSGPSQGGAPIPGQSQPPQPSAQGKPAQPPPSQTPGPYPVPPQVPGYPSPQSPPFRGQPPQLQTQPQPRQQAPSPNQTISPPSSGYQPRAWTCPNCQVTVDSKYEFCTSCGNKHHH